MSKLMRASFSVVLAVVLVLGLAVPALAWARVTFQNSTVGGNLWVYTTSFTDREGGYAESYNSGNTVTFRTTSRGGSVTLHECSAIGLCNLSHPSVRANSRCKQNLYTAHLYCYYKKT